MCGCEFVKEMKVGKRWHKYVKDRQAIYPSRAIRPGPGERSARVSLRRPCSLSLMISDLSLAVTASGLDDASLDLIS